MPERIKHAKLDTKERTLGSTSREVKKRGHTQGVTSFLIGDLERIRTSDPQLRRLLLYPAELRDQ